MFRTAFSDATYSFLYVMPSSYRFLYLGVLLIAFVGCNTSEHSKNPQATSPAHTDTTRLHGEWTWVESKGGKMGATRTPQTEAYTLQAIFHTDGTFRFTQNDTLLVGGQYTVTTAKTETTVTYTPDAPPSRSTVLSWASVDGPIQHTLRMERKDHILLDEGCCDRYRHIFRKLP